MPDLFDFGGEPIEAQKPAGAPREPEWIVPPPKPKAAPNPAPAPTPARPRPGLVASFACIACSAQDEVLEPAPDRIRCWGCGGEARRWRPPAGEPPAISARELRERDHLPG